MDNDDKPFVCPAPDCGMRFTNSDHLSVHQQKHQLSITIGLRQGESIVDQTPTPTRFLPKTTEDGGELFEGLPDSNPFDQDFKKAAALSTVPSAPTSVLLPVISVSPPESNGNDSIKPTSTTVMTTEKGLMKPVSLANIKIVDGNSGLTKRLQEGGTGNVTIVVNTQKNPVQQLSSGVKQPATVLIQGQSSIQSIILNQKPKTSIEGMPIVGLKTAKGPIRSAVPHPAIVTPRSQQNGTADAKQRLKEVLQQNASAVSTVTPLPNASPPQQAQTFSVSSYQASSPSSSIKSDNSDLMNNDLDDDLKSVPIKRSRRSQDEMDPDERRRRFLERNRAAASRCRQKRKVWVQQLEKKADDLSSTNVSLQNEINILRTEVAQLKALLLAHKDCPITMQQQKALIKQTNSSYVDQSESSLVTMTTISQQRFETAEEVASSALTDMANQGQIVEQCKNRLMTNVSVISGSKASSIDTTVIAN